jgi:hypothetical protein
VTLAPELLKRIMHSKYLIQRAQAGAPSLRVWGLVLQGWVILLLTTSSF